MTETHFVLRMESTLLLEVQGTGTGKSGSRLDLREVAGGRGEGLCVLKHQGERAEHLCAVTEWAVMDLDVVGGAGDRVASAFVAQRVEQDVAAGRHLAADDDAARGSAG